LLLCFYLCLLRLPFFLIFFCFSSFFFYTHLSPLFSPSLSLPHSLFCACACVCVRVRVSVCVCVSSPLVSFFFHVSSLSPSLSLLSSLISLSPTSFCLFPLLFLFYSSLTFSLFLLSLSLIILSVSAISSFCPQSLSFLHSSASLSLSHFKGPEILNVSIKAPRHSEQQHNAERHSAQQHSAFKTQSVTALSIRCYYAECLDLPSATFLLLC
jgi:hypothetical protein